MKIYFTILLILIIAGTHLGAQMTADQVSEAIQNLKTMEANFEDEKRSLQDKMDSFKEDQNNLYRKIDEFNARYGGQSFEEGSTEYEAYLSQRQGLEFEKESIDARKAELAQEGQRLLAMQAEVSAAASALRNQLAEQQEQQAAAEQEKERIAEQQKQAAAEQEKERIAEQQKQAAAEQEKERIAEQQKQQEAQRKSEPAPGTPAPQVGPAGELAREVGLRSVQQRPAAPPAEPRNPATAIDNSRTRTDIPKNNNYQKTLQALNNGNEANAFNAEMMKLNPGMTQAQLFQQHKWAQAPNGGQAGTARGASDLWFSGGSMAPAEVARREYDRTEQIFDKGMNQIRSDSSTAQAIVADLKGQLESGAKLSASQAALLGDSLAAMNNAGLPIPPLSVTRTLDGGLSSAGADSDSGALSANNIIEDRQIQQYAQREMQNTQQKSDAALDIAQKQHDEAKDAYYTNNDDWTQHPDIDGSPLTQPEIDAARQAVLNGQPLDPAVQDKLDQMQDGIDAENAAAKAAGEKDYSQGLGDTKIAVLQLIGTLQSILHPGAPADSAVNQALQNAEGNK